MAKERHKNIPACYLVLFKENKVLLLRRFNTGYEDGKYSMIAGHVDPGESFSKCMIREAEEEAGIVVKSEDLEFAHLVHRKSKKFDEDRVDVFFVAEKWEGELVNKECHKCDDLSWFDLDDLPENILPYLNQVLNGIKNKVFYSEYDWE